MNASGTLEVDVSAIDAAESVVLFPTFGFCDLDDGLWRMRIQGQVRAVRAITLRQRILLRFLRRAMQAPGEALAGPIFRERVRGFLTCGEGGRRLVVRVADRDYALRRPTAPNGDFAETIVLPPQATPPAEAQVGATLPLRVAVSGGAGRVFAGRAQLIGPRGLSVISDIDDTLKHSDVAHKRELLRNTFLRPFAPVAGMAEVYRGWAAAGAAFHYVSSSPWQLLEPLEAMRQTAGFPEGSFHLRSFRPTTAVLRKLLIFRPHTKARTILALLHLFPQRRFVLVGDSGELDPEIYGAVARRRPHQVAAILLRELPSRPFAGARRRRALRRLPPALCRTFREPGEIASAAADAMAAVAAC